MWLIKLQTLLMLIFTFELFIEISSPIQPQHLSQERSFQPQQQQPVAVFLVMCDPSMNEL